MIICRNIYFNFLTLFFFLTKTFKLVQNSDVRRTVLVLRNKHYNFAAELTKVLEGVLLIRFALGFLMASKHYSKHMRKEICSSDLDLDKSY